MIDQPADDGGRREQRQRPHLAPECEQLGGIDAARGGHHVPRTRHQVRDGVDAGAMRDRRGVGDGVALRHRVHVDEVSQAHGHQVAVRQHHALGPAGGAAGVEQPGHVAEQPLGHRHGQRIGRGGEQGVGIGRIERDLALQPGQGLGRHIGRHEAPARAAVGHDPFHLARVQLGVHRHRHHAGPPDAPQRLQVARVVVGEQQHAVALGQAGLAQALRQAGTARGPLAVRGVQRAAAQDGRRLGPLPGLPDQQMGQGHGVSPCGLLFSHSGSGWQRPGSRERQRADGC